MTVASHDTTAALDLLEAPPGRAGHDAVRDLVTSPLDHGLAELVREALPDARPETLRVLRSKYKPGRKLTGYYSMVDSEEDLPRHLAVSWTVDGQVRLMRSPADPDLPQLARLSDPARLGRLVDELCGHGRRAGGARITTLRYRPGQRHVLRARFPVGPAVYVKIDRDTSGARAVPVARLLRQLFAQRSPSTHAVEPLGFSPSERAALWWQAPGGGLASHVSGGGTGAASAVEQLGRAVRVIHDSSATRLDLPEPVAVGTRTVESEVAETLRAGQHIAALLPAAGVTYANLVSDVVVGLDALPREPATMVHGDLKSENVLVGGRSLHLLDLDRVCRAEPAVDLGKLLADVRWWSPSARTSDGLEQAFQAGYGPCDRLRWARAELFATLFEVRFAARRCLLHDPAWPRRVRAQLALAARPAPTSRSR